MHITAMLPLAVKGYAFKDVNLTVVNIFDTGHAIEEHINWKSPIFCKAI